MVGKHWCSQHDCLIINMDKSGSSWEPQLNLKKKNHFRSSFTFQLNVGKTTNSQMEYFTPHDVYLQGLFAQLSLTQPTFFFCKKMPAFLSPLNFDCIIFEKIKSFWILIWQHIHAKWHQTLAKLLSFPSSFFFFFF